MFYITFEIYCNNKKNKWYLVKCRRFNMLSKLRQRIMKTSATIV